MTELRLTNHAKETTFCDISRGLGEWKIHFEVENQVGRVKKKCERSL